MRADTVMTFRDRLGALKVRCGIGRNNYKVTPGLYALGSPDDKSAVFVSANYKLTFDSLRKELSGMDCYILILDTKGVNVWCAAGKGTFGTDELVSRIEKTGLAGIVSHRELILPQLGASGVCAHNVKRRTGFEVIYGPVRASDIKKFIAAGMDADDDMRAVRFTTRDRIVLVPMEFIPAMKFSLPIFGILFLANMILREPFGIEDLATYMCALAAGAVLTPVLLPIIPGRAFSLKGWIVGILLTLFAVWQFGWLQDDIIVASGYLLLIPSVSAYFAMNFTGSSTYTSPSGVLKEMRFAVPFILITVIIGSILLFIGKVIV
jgi:hypothetical protein